MKDLRAFCLFICYALISAGLALITHWPNFSDTDKAETRDKPFASPTEFTGDPGVYRWAVKIDESKPPQTGIIPVTAGGMARWSDLESPIHKDSPREGNETNWYELTGRVVLVKAEDDGDLHIQIANKYGAGVNVVVEVPFGKPWDEIRRQVFSWSTTKFPCEAHELKLTKHPVVTVVGKGFWDGQHHSKVPNRRSEGAHGTEVAVWELHPVMKLTEEK